MFLCRCIPNTSLCLARAEAAGSRQAAGSGQRAGALHFAVGWV